MPFRVTLPTRVTPDTVSDPGFGRNPAVFIRPCPAAEYEAGFMQMFQAQY